jgi:2,5-diketo-D-gluconate reductase A
MASYQQIGLGTYKLQDNICLDIIKNGLELGYRQIDTAQLYHNHTYISMGIKLSNVPREEIFIISKISNSNIRKLKIAESIDLIKKELDTDYIDLILLHNPVKNYENGWEDLIRCQIPQNIKNIGVSNFESNHLDKIISQTNITPWLNQIELNIFNQQDKLIQYNKSKGIITQSHTTLTKSNLLNNKELIELADIVGLSPSNTHILMFKFVLDKGIGILPRTSNFTHLEQNLNLGKMKKIFDLNFNLANSDLIKKFDIGYKIY